MKTKNFLTVTALFLIISAFGQKATIDLTFTAMNNDTYVQLDSIMVKNQTQGGDTVLLWPDTVLVLDYQGVGINGLNRAGERLQVFQNYPNPVIDQTTITLFIPEKDNVVITITDMPGGKMINREMMLDRGYHTFRYLPGEGEICFFSAFWQGTGRSIKILSPGTGSGRKSYLEYTGSMMEESHTKSLGSIQSFPFDLGDSLRYIGYAITTDTIPGSDVIVDAPETNTNYEFAIIKGHRCPGTPTVTDMEGNVYYTVQIGNQCWLVPEYEIQHHQC